MRKRFVLAALLALSVVSCGPAEVDRKGILELPATMVMLVVRSEDLINCRMPDVALRHWTYTPERRPPLVVFVKVHGAGGLGAVRGYLARERIRARVVALDQVPTTWGRHDLDLTVPVVLGATPNRHAVLWQGGQPTDSLLATMTSFFAQES